MNNLVNIFPQINHELIIPLRALDDFQVCKKWKKEPYKVRYLLVIFFRYYKLENIININISTQELVDKYYVQLWYFIFEELFTNISLRKSHDLKDSILFLTEKFLSEQDILVMPPNITSNFVEENVKYLPLQYFVEKALDKLYPLERIIIVAKNKFGWEDDKILEYLQQQQTITSSKLKAYYTQAYSRIINSLTKDIITIYFNDDN